MSEAEELKDHCGIFGIFAHPEAANLTYLGLHALQHRGQEAAGIASSDGRDMRVHRAMGLVADAFDAVSLGSLVGDRAIGHVRYATCGPSALDNAQPLIFSLQARRAGLGPQRQSRQRRCDSRGACKSRASIFHTTSDTEIIGHLIAKQRAEHSGISLADAIGAALRQVAGAYSLLFLSNDQLIAARDPFGFRPLVIGKLRDSYTMASETCALDLIGAEYLGEVEPGQMVILDRSGLSRRQFADAPAAARAGRCVFEHIYFARPDSLLFGQSVHEVRKRLGRELARERPAEADVVIPVPDSGVPAAIGFG